jgi:hypothetical protein
MKKKSNKGKTQKRRGGGDTTYCCAKDKSGCVVSSTGYCFNTNEKKQKCTPIDRDTIMKTMKKSNGKDYLGPDDLTRIERYETIPFYDTGKTNTDIPNGLQYVYDGFYVCNDGTPPSQGGKNKKRSKKRSKKRK